MFPFLINDCNNLGGCGVNLPASPSLSRNISSLRNDKICTEGIVFSGRFIRGMC